MVVETGPSGSGPGASGEATQEPIWDRPHRPPWMRVLNGVGGALGRVGVRRPGLEVGSIVAAAERRAGLSDWGEGTVREGLRALVAAFEAQGQTHTFGRIFFRENCIRLLVNHLRYSGRPEAAPGDRGCAGPSATYHHRAAPERDDVPAPADVAGPRRPDAPVLGGV